MATHVTKIVYLFLLKSFSPNYNVTFARKYISTENKARF